MKSYLNNFKRFTSSLFKNNRDKFYSQTLYLLFLIITILQKIYIYQNKKIIIVRFFFTKM